MPHALLFDEQQITKALTRPAVWKIPDDFATAPGQDGFAALRVALLPVLRRHARAVVIVVAPVDFSRVGAGRRQFHRRRQPIPRARR